MFEAVSEIYLSWLFMQMFVPYLILATSLQQCPFTEQKQKKVTCVTGWKLVS